MKLNSWTRGQHWLALILLVSPILTGVTLQAQIDTVPHRDHSDSEDCPVCHADAKHPGLSALPSNIDCVSCHAQLASTQTQDDDKAATKTTHAKSHDAKDPYQGMSLPPYYSETLRGENPNTMVFVAAGPFIMGTNDRLPDEAPQYTVTLNSYYIDQWEVTNLQYLTFINATHRRSPQHFTNRSFPEGKADHPVVFVSWNDADAYCHWAGKRLPTEEEWEKAARGDVGRIFPWGDEFDSDKANTPHRWNEAHKDGDTLPVGSFNEGRSPYGVYDMTGNVWEWTSSWYTPHPGNHHINENYGEKYKVLKGGSWWDCSFYKCGISAPAYNRSFFLKSTRNSSFGFRCAKDA
ncbi:MAG: formylglycine-generating enzyme family protein [Gammaproteobacteria bacterium]|nr:formylglycine-generating enzyme family protein [Gammaproteobacteria bacterium]